MKHNFSLKFCSFLLFLGFIGINSLQAQSFKQGSFNISLSGGSTTANYGTKNTGDGKYGSGSKKTIEGITDRQMGILTIEIHSHQVKEDGGLRRQLQHLQISDGSVQ